jgi:hypothetical protein
VEAAQPARVEEGLARARRLHRSADALQPRQHALGRLGHADRVGRHEGQARAARERLPHAHAGVDAERLGGLRDLPDHQLAAGLGRERRRLAQQARAPAGGDDELEPLQQDADDHGYEHTFASSDRPRK